VIQTAILHGAGYVGRKLIEQVLVHPELELVAVTSRSHAGEPIWAAHKHLRAQSPVHFTSTLDMEVDLVFVAAGHGQGAAAVSELRISGFNGLVIDMSADFRLADPQTYLERYEVEHPRPDLLSDAWYGLPEITGPPPKGTTLIANPGCFASAISLALYPLSQAGLTSHVSVMALTGASGSGALAKAGTHYPSRAGNVKAYKVLEHQHEAEIDEMAPGISYSFVPVSGPFTSGIWGTAQFSEKNIDLAAQYHAAYDDHPFIRLWPGQIPELHWSVGSPFTDIGWIQKGNQWVVGFAIDNLMKGAATQAIQNANLALGFSETTGLFHV